MPETTPVTIPVEDPIVAMPVLLLVQVPPEVASANVTTSKAHTEAVPVIEFTVLLTTVTACVIKQPLLPVYVIVGAPVVPTPVTTPEDVTDANEDELVVHVPEGVASVNVVTLPTHNIVVGAVIAAGAAFMVAVAIE